MRVLVLLLVAVAITAAHANSFMKNEVYLTDQEKTLAMDEAIQEAMVVMEARKIAEKNRVTSNKRIDYTSFQLLHKLFKRPSEEAKKLGKADHLYRDIVDRAERKMLEVKRAKVKMSQGPNARDEFLAETLDHRPGSIITSAELTRAWQLAQNVFNAAKKAPDCSNNPTVDQFRTIDGTCNNEEHPRWGSAPTLFSRPFPALYDDGKGVLRTKTKIGPLKDLPNARLVSRTVVRNRFRGRRDEIPFTHLLMQFGQFLDHDMDLGPEEPDRECSECECRGSCRAIPILGRDRAFSVHGNTRKCIPFLRSLSIPSQLPQKPGIREQVNDVTSFIDGSMIYGSNTILADILRGKEKKEGGLLLEGKIYKKQKKPSLPYDTDENVLCRDGEECFLCGDARCNEQISLTVMHTLWLREHNRCARAMTVVNPLWLDERLYQECRKIVGALIQKIVYKDYLPKIMGRKAFRRFITKYKSYKKNTNPSIPNSFATAAYRYGHSIIRPEFARCGKGYSFMTPLKLREAFFNPQLFKEDDGGTDPIARGWVSEHSRTVDQFMNKILTTELFKTDKSPGLDLASLNIQRGRDHGLPPYSVFRKMCMRRFRLRRRNFKIPKKPRNQLKKLYGSVGEADVWLAGLAEKRLKGALIGPTFACIFGITFANVRDGDRFFWEKEGVFTSDQKKSIKRHTISKIICDNSDNITDIQRDAFKDSRKVCRRRSRRRRRRRRCNNRRKSCCYLKGVNFNLWRETEVSTKEVVTQESAVFQELESEDHDFLEEEQDMQDDVFQELEPEDHDFLEEEEDMQDDVFQELEPEDHDFLEEEEDMQDDVFQELEPEDHDFLEEEEDMQDDVFQELESEDHDFLEEEEDMQDDVFQELEYEDDLLENLQDDILESEDHNAELEQCRGVETAECGVKSHVREEALE